jgi:serine/threonine protein kinase
VQLCVFGLVVVGDATNARLTTTAHANGTAAWMSPQRLTGTRYRITEADDVYSYACLCYYVSKKLSSTFASQTFPRFAQDIHLLMI